MLEVKEAVEKVETEREARMTIEKILCAIEAGYCCRLGRDNYLNQAQKLVEQFPALETTYNPILKAYRE